VLQRSNLDPHQLSGAEWIKRNDNCALHWDVGVQKTATTLTAFVDMLATFDTRRMLVIAPKRVARKGWPREIASWEHLKHLSVSPIVGTAEECLRALRTPADVHTINYDRIQWLYAQFVQHGKQVARWPWDMVAADEAHRLRNASGVRWRQMEAFRAAKLFPRMVQLTGTYTPNGLRNAWAPMYLLDRGKRLGVTEDGYLKKFFVPPKHEFGKWTPKPGAPQAIAELVGDICYTLRAEEVMTLPPVILNPIMVELAPAALREYRKLKQKFIAEIGGAKITAANSAALGGKLLQIANGAVYDEDKNVILVHQAKIEALDDLCGELVSNGKQALIVYAFKHDKDRILGMFQRPDWGGANVRSLVTDADEDAWAAGDLDFMLIHPDSAGEGTNLHLNVGAEDVIWFGGTNDLLKWIQTNGRLFGGKRRLGKKGKIHVLLADGTIDEDYRELIEMKNAEQDDFKVMVAKYARR
jgi:SNF2 family DNA or RNA helicase